MINIPRQMEMLRNLWVNWGSSHPFLSSLVVAAVAVAAWWIFGGIMWLSESRSHQRITPMHEAVETEPPQAVTAIDKVTKPTQVTLPPETVKTVKLKLSHLPRLSMFVDGKLQDSDTWEMIDQIRTVFRETGHQAESGRLTDGDPTRGEIAIYLMENPSPELVDAITMICEGFGRTPTFSKTLRGNDVQILIGPPESLSQEPPSKIPLDSQVQVAWNFSSFLSMLSGAFDKGITKPQFRVHSFQASGWSSRIAKISGYIEIDNTGDRFPLKLNSDGKVVDLAQMPIVESDERVAVVCPFTKDHEPSSWTGIDSNIFLERYTPFTFVVSVNEGAESKYHFSTDRCRDVVQLFITSVLRSKH